MSDDLVVTRLPYPKNLEDAATLAVETAFQEMGRRGAFDEHGLPESAQIFGKACAYTALKQLCAAAINETMPTVADRLESLTAENAALKERLREAGEVMHRLLSNLSEGDFISESRLDEARAFLKQEDQDD